MRDGSELNQVSVSVVIPAYNGQEHIGRAIDSVLSQSLRADEIIVVDDGSTDGTAEIVKGYGEQVRYIYQENAGVSAACNTGIRAAKGDWVAFVDTDDHWLDEKLHQQVDVVKRNSDLVWVGCNYYFHDVRSDRRSEMIVPATAEYFLKGKDYLESFFVNGNPRMHWCWTRSSMMLKRSVFDEIGMFLEGYDASEDLDMWLRIAVRYPKIGFVNRALVVYSFGAEGSLSKRNYAGLVSERCESFDAYLKDLAGHERFDEIRRFIGTQISKYIFKFYCDDSSLHAKELVDRYGKILSFRFRVVMRLVLVLLPCRAPYARQIVKRLLGKGY